MAENFSGVPVGFTGSLLPKPISLCTPLPKGTAPFCVVLDVPWDSYPGGAVSVNLQVQGAANPIDQIRSVSVDNTDVPYGAYIRFPDTRDTVVAKPGSIIKQPVFTKSLEFQIFASAPAIALSSGKFTRIILSNIYIDPILEEEFGLFIGGWRTSSTPPTDLNAYDAASLGDRTVGNVMALTAAGVSPPVFAAQASGYYAITNFEIFITGCYMTTVPTIGQVFFENVAGTTIVLGTIFTVPTDLSLFGQKFTILKQDRSNIKIDATQAWQMRNVVPLSQGFMTWTFSWTYAARDDFP